MIAACATACIIARANHGDVQLVTAQRLYRTEYAAELAAGYPEGWTAACAAARDFQGFLRARGLHRYMGVEVQFASMYAAPVYGVPASCWTVNR